MIKEVERWKELIKKRKNEKKKKKRERIQIIVKIRDKYVVELVK